MSLKLNTIYNHLSFVNYIVFVGVKKYVYSENKTYEYKTKTTYILFSLAFYPACYVQTPLNYVFVFSVCI